MLERLFPSIRQKNQDAIDPSREVWNMLDTYMASPFAMRPTFDRITPTVDVSETTEDVTVTAELPGMKLEDVELQVENNYLMIRGHKKSESEKKKENYVHRECSYGAFSRSVPLPAEIQPDKATAKYKNGVLTVHLPKNEKAHPKRISIES
jgi:HSP20 family protein